MLTVAPPALVTGALKDSARPTGSLNPATPLITPVAALGALRVNAPTCGVPTPTATVTVTGVLLTPLDAVTVNESVVLAVAC